jgi:hypothetical protein
LPKKTIQIKQQEIRSLIENFDWETNPKWQDKWKKISYEVDDFWKNYLRRDSQNKPIK